MAKNIDTGIETSTQVSLGTKISLGYMIATAVFVLVSVIATVIWTISGSSSSSSVIPESSVEQSTAPQNYSFTFTAVE